MQLDFSVSFSCNGQESTPTTSNTSAQMCFGMAMAVVVTTRDATTTAGGRKEGWYGSSSSSSVWVVRG
jgi:hypothetical protein